jgi:DNA-binding Lrp family transcriptional regulator
VTSSLLEIPSTPARGLRELRDRNSLRVIEALRREHNLSQANIARNTGLSRTTVSAVITELKQQGIIEEHLVAERAVGGRPGIRLKLTPSALTVMSPGADHWVDRINQLTKKNGELALEVDRLKSILCSIEKLAGNAESYRPGQGSRVRPAMPNDRSG